MTALRQCFGRRFLGLATAVILAASCLHAAPAVAADANYAAIVVDGKTGQVLYSRQADATRYPASLTKMMTLYLLFEDLERGRFTLTSRLSVSANAAAQAPTKLDLAVGSTIRVEDAILAIVTRSANDVAMVIAENLGGSSAVFAERMTATARSIGMSHTTFRNPHGLPDSRQVTTARDMATLGRALQDRFPQYYHYFSTPSFTWHGVRMANHNALLDLDGVDGIKTGYTRASGYNLVTSIHRDNRYIVAVVMGGDTAAARDSTMRSLIATNLPRASAGPRTAPLVAVAAAGPFEAPLPRPSPNRADPVVTAATTPRAPDAIAVLAQGDIDPVVAAAAPPPGWKIQIGALPSEVAAQAVLARAMQLEATLLSAKTPFTETVTVNGTLAYRARFGGFASSAAAQSACARLVRLDFQCFATQ